MPVFLLNASVDFMKAFADANINVARVVAFLPPGTAVNKPSKSQNAKHYMELTYFTDWQLYDCYVEHVQHLKHHEHLVTERVQQVEREKREQRLEFLEGEQRYKMEQIAAEQQALCRTFAEGHIRKPQDSERERMREAVCSFVLLDETVPRPEAARECEVLQQMVLHVLFEGRDKLQRSWQYLDIETEIANRIQEVNMSTDLQSWQATVLRPDVRDKVVSLTVHSLYLLKPDAPIQSMKPVRQDQEKAELAHPG